MTTALLVLALFGTPSAGGTPGAAPGTPDAPGIALAVAEQAPAAAQQPGGAAAGRYIEETELERQVREISAQLRCVVCQGLSLQDSPSQLAQEMRAIVREKLEEGMTPAEVRVYFVERYGEWVLLQPDPRGFNLLVYVLPLAMLLGGGGFVFFQARSWTRSGAAAADGAVEDEELAEVGQDR
jgi:cytochrome c-type biogenesis protein CcmH/NrfF